MDLKSFTFDIREGVAHVTWNQPERGNPFDATFAREFKEIATECTVNPAVRAVLMDAKGRFFSVGGDLNALTSSREGLARFVTGATADLHMGVARFARMNAPIVTAVHGLAAGGAVGVLAGADFVLASSEAKFYAAFLGIGVGPDSGMSYYLPRRVGSGRAAEFLMLNQTWSADEAKEAGLVTRVLAPDRLSEEAWALARRLAEGPTVAFGAVKNLLLSSPAESIERQLELEARGMARVSATQDAWDAMTAVKAKTKPIFHGR